MPIYYNNNSIIPAPFITIGKQYQTTDDGEQIGSTYNISVKGKFLPDKGSPTSSGTFWTSSGYPPDETVTPTQALASIKVKQQALRKLFSLEGLLFEIVPWDGSASMKCNPRVKSIDFPESNWGIPTIDYQIQLECDTMTGLAGEDTGNVSNYKIGRASEEWNIEVADEKLKTFRLTHAVSAVGKRFYKSDGSLQQEAWKEASGWVLPRLGFSAERMYASGVLNLFSYQPFNHMRSQKIDEKSGGFSVAETWVCIDFGGEPAATEEFNITQRDSIQDGLNLVNIEGSIVGYEQNTTFVYGSGRYQNAYAKFGAVQSSLLARCQNITGLSLNSQYVSRSIGRNQTQGTISYNYEFNDRPTAAIAGAKSETIQETYKNRTDVFAAIPVLGRAFGPVLQSIGTFTQREYGVSIEAVFPMTTTTKPNTNSVVLTYQPSGTTQIYVSRDDETWSRSTGRYSRQVNWVYEL